MSQQEVIRYNCPNPECPTRRGHGNSWWEITQNGRLRCTFCFKEYTRAQLERETRTGSSSPVLFGNYSPPSSPREENVETMAIGESRSQQATQDYNYPSSTPSTPPSSNPSSPPPIHRNQRRRQDPEAAIREEFQSDRFNRIQHEFQALMMQHQLQMNMRREHMDNSESSEDEEEMNREGKRETEAREQKVDETFEINELKKKIIKAKKKSTNQPAARHLLFKDSKTSKPKKPREAYDVYVGDTPITELLKDKDEDGDPQNNIILQRDTKPFNAVALPKDYLKNVLTTNSYFNQTKYQCKNNITDSLDVTENNIVFDKESRETYQFINGNALNIHDGIFLRTQLLAMLNSQNKHFLYHVHKKINITPIASADKVRWYSPPKKIKGWADNIPDWNSYEQGTALNEAHMEVGDMVSADHCQKGFTNFLITIAPMKKRRTATFYSKKIKIKRNFGGGRKSGKRKTKNKKNKRKRKKKKKTRKKK